MELVKAEAGRLARLGIKFERTIAAVLQKFNARQSRAEADIERAPVAGLVQGVAQTRHRVTEEADRRHARQQAAFP